MVRYTKRPMSPADRLAALRAALEERILVLDGAMGTAIQAVDLTAADFGGASLEGCNEHLVLTRPDVIEIIHRDYINAGADIIETDTFGGTRVVLAEYGLQDKVYEINFAAAQLARKAADAASTAKRPRFVAGSMGPGTKTISVTGGITFDEVQAAYTEQTIGLVEGGVDVLYLETQQDTLNVKAALLGIDDACARLGRSVPVVLSVSIETMGTMLAGQSIEALYVSVAHRDLLAIGMNCATGPDFMTDHLRTLHELATTRISCYPNAGLPNPLSETGFDLGPQDMARYLGDFARGGLINIAGGCCGNTPEHIAAIAKALDGQPPRKYGNERSAESYALQSEGKE